jgi:hypothetical protein
MPKLAETATPSAEEFASGPAGPAWAALAEWLERRGAELREEVRDYPTPIARCDVQLTKLLEQRGAVLAAAGSMRARECRSPGAFPTRAAIEAVLACPASTDDPQEELLRARLRSSLFSLPCLD